jgi:hypothetical protein
MRAVVNNLMASLLLIQVSTGWCWHGADGCADCHDPTVQRVAATIGCEDDHCKSYEHRDESPDPCRDESECHGVCTYVPSHETRLDMAQLAVSFDIMPFALIVADHGILSGTTWERASHFDFSEPPLRLHLLHQLLLI